MKSKRLFHYTWMLLLLLSLLSGCAKPKPVCNINEPVTTLYCHNQILESNAHATRLAQSANLRGRWYRFLEWLLDFITYAITYTFPPAILLFLAVKVKDTYVNAWSLQAQRRKDRKTDGMIVIGVEEARAKKLPANAIHTLHLKADGREHPKNMLQLAHDVNDEANNIIEARQVYPELTGYEAITHDDFVVGTRVDTNEPLKMNLLEAYHSSIGGKAGAGKSNFVAYFCAATLYQTRKHSQLYGGAAEFIVFDPQGHVPESSMDRLKHLPDDAFSYVRYEYNQFGEKTAVKHFGLDEMLAGIEMLKSLIKRREQNPLERSIRIVIFEEMGKVRRDKPDVYLELQQLAEQIVEECRKLKIYALFVAHQFGKEIGRFKSNINNAFTFQSNRDNVFNQVRRLAEYLPRDFEMLQRGQMYAFLQYGEDEAPKVKTPLVSDDDIRRAIALVPKPRSDSSVGTPRKKLELIDPNKLIINPPRTHSKPTQNPPRNSSKPREGSISDLDIGNRAMLEAVYLNGMSPSKMVKQFFKSSEYDSAKNRFYDLVRKYPITMFDPSYSIGDLNDLEPIDVSMLLAFHVDRFNQKHICKKVSLALHGSDKGAKYNAVTKRFNQLIIDYPSHLFDDTEKYGELEQVDLDFAA